MKFLLKYSVIIAADPFKVIAFFVAVADMFAFVRVKLNNISI